MVRCAFCGSENEPEAAYCGTCGKPIVAAPPDPPSGNDGTLVPTGNGDGHKKEASLPKPPLNAPNDNGGAPPPPPDPDPDTAPGAIICPRCGTSNEPTRVFCRKCAKDLRPPPPPPPDPPDPDPRPRIPPIVIPLAALGFVVVLGIGILVALGGQSKPPIASASTVPSVQPSVPITAPPASPSPSVEPSPSSSLEPDTPPGEIVFAAGRDNIDLYLVNADGSGEARRLTRAAGRDGDPAFSPDGAQIAYTSEKGMRILDLESGRTRSFTDVPSDRNPYWSPKGDAIVFSRGYDDKREIFRMDLDSQKASQLTDNKIEDHDPVWSPDGRTIVWVVGSDDERELWVMDLDGKVIDELTDDDINDVDPAYSPSGDRIVFASRQGQDGQPQDHLDLWILDLASEELTQLTDLKGDEHDPWWSPGGRFVVFHGGSRDELPGTERDEDLFIVDTTDGEITRLRETDDRELTPTWRP